MKTKHSVLGPLYRQSLFSLAIHPATYFICATTILFCVIQFFIGQQFFTESGSTDLRHFFSAVPYICILAIPSLAVLLPHNDEDVLLPVTPFTIPLSQFLALLTVMCATVLLTLGVPIAVGFYGTVELSQVICGYFGIILYLCTSISLAVFLMHLFKSAGASFIATTLVLAVSNGAHLVALYVNLPTVLHSFLRAISFAWHFDAAGKGIIDTRDVCFYALTSFAFIMLTGMTVELRRGRNRYFTKAAILTAVIIVFALADSNAIYTRIDTTKGRRFSLTEYSRTLLSEVDEPLTMTYYRSHALQELYPQVRDVHDFLDEYSSLNPNVSFTTIDPSKASDQESQTIETRLQQYGINPQQIQTAGRESTSVTSVYSAIVIDYLDKTEVIPFVLDTSTLEYDIAGRISALIRSTKRTVQIVVANSRSLDGDYTYVQPWLESQGFTTTRTILPSQADSTPGTVFNTLPDTPLLVIGTSSFTAQDTEALEQFILNNGKAFIATTPYSVDIDNDWSVARHPDKVCRLLNSWGFSFLDTLTADISNFRITLTSDTNKDGSASKDTATEYVNYPLWPILQPQTYALNGMTLFWPCAMDIPEDTGIEPILLTSKASWQIESVDGKYETNPFSVSQSGSDAHEKKPYTVCAYTKGTLPGYYTTGSGTTGGLYVLGDQYAFSTLMFNYSAGSSGDFRSLDFLTDSLLKLEGEEAILPLKNRNYVSTQITKKQPDELHQDRLPVTTVVCAVPLMIIALLAVICILLRRKYNHEGKEGAL